MKILLTGSTGFLGKHFIQYLNSNFPNQFEIIESNTKQNNLLSYETLKRYDGNLKIKSFDYIFHFAAYTKAGDWCLKHPGEQWLINQQINTNIIKFWREYSPDAMFIGIGTSCSYGNQDNNLWKAESKYLDDLPEKSLLTYAYTKRMLYLGMDAMNKQYGMGYLYFVPSTLYGTDFTESDNHFIYDIVRKIYNAKYNDIQAEMWGSGFQKRELTWVEDFVKLMCNTVFETNYKNEIINIASGHENNMEYYYKQICELFEYDYNNIIKNQSKYIGMHSNKLHCSYPEIREFNYKPLEEGLSELVNYYKQINKI